MPETRNNFDNPFIILIRVRFLSGDGIGEVGVKI